MSFSLKSSSVSFTEVSPLLCATSVTKVDATTTQTFEYSEPWQDDPNPFLDPTTKRYWRKVYESCSYEGLSLFDPTLTWTAHEESAVIHILDQRVTILACVMFMALQIDRGNISQAISDDMLGDLGLSSDDFNLSNTLSKVAFLVVEIPSGMLCKRVGPQLWLPLQMILWSIAAIAQGFVKGKNGFLLTRTTVAVLEGGFIPEMVLWLSYFFTSRELGMKLAYFWSSGAATQCICGVLAFFILRLRGTLGLEGWRWLFILEGFLTLFIGVAAYFLMVPTAVETTPWFTSRQQKIAINRILRDDPSKGDMHVHQSITLKLMWNAIKDYDLWPVYMLGFLAFIPVNTISNYFTLILKEAGFSTFTVNLLGIPYNAIHVVLLISITKISEYFNERSLIAMVAPLWVIPGLVILRWGSDWIQQDKFALFVITTFILSQPYIHSMNVSWVSRNSNSVKTRAISAAMYNMFNQAGAAMAANVYRADDAPAYHRGNRQLLWLSCFTVVYLAGVKLYYLARNAQKEKIWKLWSIEEREDYILETGDEGNKRLDFRFVH